MFTNHVNAVMVWQCALSYTQNSASTCSTEQIFNKLWNIKSTN